MSPELCTINGVLTPDWDSVRLKMVVEQLVARGIDDSRVLEAMRRVPRHLFVPEPQQKRSYEDRALTIGHDQTISQPYIVAVMLQALELTGQEKVLEIGAGSGYEAVLLGHLAKEVHTVEVIPELLDVARNNPDVLAMPNIQLHEGDGSLGWPSAAPYDAIVVSAAAPDIPRPLLDQLTPTGKLLIPLGDRTHQMLTLLKKKGSDFTQETFGTCAFVPLRGAHGWSNP
jgi:protein-L-isoaspartate(D-aspartate) O-methyltransferase